MRAIPATLMLPLLVLLLAVTATVESGYGKVPGVPSATASQFLSPHNKVRAALGMRPLAWDKKLEKYAKWWAGQRENDCALRHSNGPYGENIFWGSGGAGGWTAAQAVGAWVGERRWYKYVSNACAGGQVCGHYTQVVWRETRKIGCAVVTCSSGRGVFMTCNYDPPGNYIGERPY